MTPIYINNEEFFINPRKDYLDEGASGKCYKVYTDDKILTVKLYLSVPALLNEENFFPNQETLKKFIELAPYTNPILLSQYLVTDHNGKYIGCARDYIEPSSPNTTDAFFHLPKEKALSHFHSIEEKIPIFNKNGILLDDWNSYNVMLGRIADGEEKLYVFDDSSYSFSSYCKQSNLREFPHLMEDMIEDYLLSYGLYEIENCFFNEIRSLSNPILFFESISEHTDTLGEGILQYAKKIKNKYY